MLDGLMRRAAKRGLTNIVPRQADARSMPYPDRFFDAAFVVGALGEIPDAGAALRELRRVLSDSGRLLIGEILFDPDFIPFSRLVGMARDAGLVFDRKNGPGFAYFALFRPAQTVRKEQVEYGKREPR
jgi:ubiquinone/menaquinone biosynthesis C-methylase UbiE